MPLVPKVVAKRWAELYLKKKRKKKRQARKTKGGIVTLWPKNVLLLSGEGKKEKKIPLCTHCSVLCLWNVFLKCFLLGHEGCRLVHSIPNLSSSSVSQVYIFLCSEQSPRTQTNLKRAVYKCRSLSFLSSLVCLLFCQHGKYSFVLLCNENRKILFAFSSTPFFPSGQWLQPLASCRQNAFYALLSDVLMQIFGAVQ